MRRHGFLTLVTLGLAVNLLSASAVGGETVVLVIDAPLSAPAARGAAALERALKARGFEPERHAALPTNGSLAAVIGEAKTSPLVNRLLETHHLDLSSIPESLAIQKLQIAGRPVLLLAGCDGRGLSYALHETARAVELAPRENKPWMTVPEALEAPFLPVRSMTIHLFNADLERPWYFSESYWRDYFSLLARCRYNNFTLCFADQTNYLCPVYAYLVDAPGYPQTRVQGLSDDQRRRNLAMLRRIAELADEHGVDFTLGVWMQLPVPRYASPVRVEQLPEGEAAADYCAQGLRRVLEECRAIRGVQLRMNAESGVDEERQAEFYRPLFHAVRDCGRPVRLEIRYKGLRPETTQAALDAGLELTVSTKFWCEHLGLPYHPTEEEPLYRESRYGFGAMLAYPRSHRILYRLWSVGSQRLFLWGDPQYAARFAESCRLGDGVGFEVFAPLTNKGYGNAPGEWRIFADRAYEHFTWEHERYWFFYLAFGRMGYNPQAGADVWRRELRHRFGAAAGDVENAYRQASQILPLITATRLPSASEWSWWPEMDTGDRLTEYMHTQPSDTGQFYAIRSWKQTPRWRCETWDATVDGYVEDAVAGRLRGKWTPIEVSRRLRELAEATIANLEQAQARLDEPPSVEFRATQLDLRVLAHLALYHSEKTLAATHLGFFEATGDRGRLPHALEHMRRSVEHWERIAELTDSVYYDALVFGTTPENLRNQFGHHHSGHWKNRLAEVREDEAYLEQLVHKHATRDQAFRAFPGETPLTDPPQIEHTPIGSAVADADVTVTARISSRRRLTRVLVHYRPLDQTVDWKEVEMRRVSENRYEAVLPGKELPPRWDFQYYFEILVESGGRLWPSWEQGQPYYVVRVERTR